MIENKRFVITKSNIIDDGWFIDDTVGNFSFDTTKDKSSLIMYEKQLNELNDENEQLKKDLKESQKLKNKRLRKVKNQRALLEDIGGVIIGYKSQLRDLHYKIDKIKEAMEDTGALTKRQLEEILK